MRIAVLALSAACALLAADPSAMSGILIDDSPLTPADTLVTVPLIGYRAFPTQALIPLPNKKSWVLDTSIIYATAATDADFLQAVGVSADDVTSLPVGKVIKFYDENTLTQHLPVACEYGFVPIEQKDKLKPYMDKSLDKYDWSKATSKDFTFPCANASSQIVQVSNNPHMRDVAFDGDFVRLAAAKGAIERADIQNPSSVRVVHVTGSGTYGVAVDPKFATAMTNVYSALGKISGPNVTTEDATAFDYVSKAAWHVAKLPEITVVRLVDVKMGIPHLFTAAEKELKVEKSILKGSDVYWLQLAVNPQADLRDTMQRLSLFVSLESKDAEALDLVPTTYGIEEEKKWKSDPHVKLGAEGVEVEIGSVYGQEVSYKSIKPTIEGTGLNDANFKWTLSGDSLSMAAKRLIAVVRVPKGSRKLQFAMMLVAKVKHGWFALQDDTATSERISEDLALPSR